VPIAKKKSREKESDWRWGDLRNATATLGFQIWELEGGCRKKGKEKCIGVCPLKHIVERE